MKIRISKSVLEEIRQVNKDSSRGAQVSKKTIGFLYHTLGARLVAKSADMTQVEAFGMRFFCRKPKKAVPKKKPHPSVAVPVPAKRRPLERHRI